MSQKNVELFIGKLATDEEFRHDFQRDPARILGACTDGGLELTPAERNALLTTDLTACDRFAEALDPRLLKVSLRSCAMHRNRS